MKTHTSPLPFRPNPTHTQGPWNRNVIWATSLPFELRLKEKLYTAEPAPNPSSGMVSHSQVSVFFPPWTHGFREVQKLIQFNSIYTSFTLFVYETLCYVLETFYRGTNHNPDPGEVNGDVWPGGKSKQIAKQYVLRALKMLVSCYPVYLTSRNISKEWIHVHVYLITYMYI